MVYCRNHAMSNVEPHTFPRRAGSASNPLPQPAQHGEVLANALAQAAAVLQTLPACKTCPPPARQRSPPTANCAPTGSRSSRRRSSGHRQRRKVRRMWRPSRPHTLLATATLDPAPLADCCAVMRMATQPLKPATITCRQTYHSLGEVAIHGGR